ncbi:DUF317 domain-containing protein [Kitasatospora sp. NPDC057965]|uniref:DUF317 domain-containing protein n=1 Tax=Kitasatospora sp. NPDC057965 TaxID=3346291 RepID=UPI0036DC5036
MTATSHIHVQPVYLAGPGDCATITTPLLQHGWAQAEDQHHPFLRAPDSDTTLYQDPKGDWHLVCPFPADGSHAWSAVFTATTPAEVLAASALATAQALAGADHGRLRELGKPDSLVTRAGWKRDSSITNPLIWRSHDGAARLLYTPDYLTKTASWAVSVTAGPQAEAGWRAHFTSGAPRWVINAVLEVAASDRPVARPADALPRASLMQLTTPTAAGLPDDRRSAAGLRFARPVRLHQAAATTASHPGTTGSCRGRR